MQKNDSGLVPEFGRGIDVTLLTGLTGFFFLQKFFLQKKKKILQE